MLGKKFGRSECSTLPMVCGCMLGLPRADPALLLELELEVGIDGGRGDWTTLMEGDSEESGGRGRKIRMGTFRKGWEGGGRRMFVMRWKEGRSSVFWLADVPLILSMDE